MPSPSSSSSFDEQSKPLFGSLVSTIRSASQLAAQDISFYKSLDRDLSQSAQECSEKLLHLANGVIQSDANEDVDELNDLDEVQENWKNIVGVLDGLFEKTELSLDEFKKAQNSSSANDQNSIEVKTKELKSLGGENSEKVIRHSKDLAKPQEKFTRKVNNSRDMPFKPLITSKPNALESYEKSMQMVSGEDVDMENMERDDDDDDDYEGESKKPMPPHFKQPYKYEIEHQKYPKMKVTEPRQYKEWDQTELVYVDTNEKLDSMIKDLKKSKEIAVDLEHHDYRSFHGFVCLMQISNREKDWIVDTLVLRDELQALNTVFTDPKIVKVFHGAFMDIIWLQRDFGLYIVSLFDTYCAAKELNLKRHSLAFLLETYANFQTSKEYQRADWRIRPIPERMLGYARADTHFLLYIYDILKNDLIEKDKLDTALHESRLVAQQRYEIPGYVNKKSLWKSILSKYTFSPAQKVVFKDLYEWRDSVARRYDESVRFVMPNHILATLCYTMPDTITGVLGASNGITFHIRSSAKDIAKVIETAKQQAENMAQESLLADDHAKVNDGEDMSKLEENYDAYEREFNKALSFQKQFFDEKKINSAYARLFTERTRLYSDSYDLSDIEVDMETSTESLHSRKELIKNKKLHLYVPLPPVAAEPYSEVDEAPNDFESIATEKFIPQVDTTENSNDDDDVEMIETKEKGDDTEEQPSVISLEPETNLAKRKSSEFDDTAMMNSKDRRKAKRRKLKLMKQEEIAKLKEVTLEDADKKRQEDETAEQQSKEQSEGDEVPFNAFDYDNAASVLENSKSNKKTKKQEKPRFDPYAQTNDDNVPKPARKKGSNNKKKNSGVKSLTFKKKK